jgi:hypothetical protein
MPFQWLKIHHARTKPDDYARKTLAAYALGMRAGGSIRGVRIQTAEQSCPAARALPAAEIYLPDEAPLIPLPACDRAETCPCVYRPVMSYESPPLGEESEAM